MIENKCDVLIVGGGAAGIAAALSAAQTGADVVLIEKYGFLGGMATAGMVGTICGLYLRDYSSTPKFVSGGFMLEFAQQLMKMSRSKSLHLNNGIHVLPYDSWQFMRLCDNLISAEKKIKTVFHGFVYDIVSENGKISGVNSVVWNKKMAFKPGCVIDCTGEATAAYLAGGKCEEDPEYNTPAYIFAIDGVEFDIEKDSMHLGILRTIKRAISEGELSKDCERITFVPSNIKDNKIYIKVSLADWEENDWNRFSAFEIKARTLVDDIFSFLRKNIKEFREAYISRVPSQIGVRIGRRANGIKTLTETDIEKCAKFNDGAACGCWPIELWEKKGNGPVMKYLPEKEYYEIPAGCMIAENFENLFMAGRCISGTVKALASARVIGAAINTGWAAGKLASFKANSKSEAEAITELRSEQVTGF